MGRKRTRTWKHIYLSVTGLIIFSLAGCSHLKIIEIQEKSPEPLTTAQNLFDQGDYKGALKENQKILSAHNNRPPGDEALFNMGLIYAHNGNPERDYKRSLSLFKRLVKEFPQSPWARQAKIWIEVLQENEKLRGETEKFNAENEKCNAKIEELNATIKKTKEIDLEIDEKKKELAK